MGSQQHVNVHTMFEQLKNEQTNEHVIAKTVGITCRCRWSSQNNNYVIANMSGMLHNCLSFRKPTTDFIASHGSPTISLPASNNCLAIFDDEWQTHECANATLINKNKLTTA